MWSQHEEAILSLIHPAFPEHPLCQPVLQALRMPQGARQARCMPPGNHGLVGTQPKTNEGTDKHNDFEEGELRE